jgi:uncharacterized protein (TIGR01777 family)
MTTQYFERATELPVSAETAYAWHARPGAFERLIPPWEPVTVRERHGDLGGGRLVLDVPIGPFRRRWEAVLKGAAEGVGFVDEQVVGPFARWRHHHGFEPLGTGRCRYVDRIEYRLPLGVLGAAAAPMVAARLERSFRYRHATVVHDLGLLQRYPTTRLTIAITGATGLLGRALVHFLGAAGHRVVGLARRALGPDDIPWDPARGLIDGSRLEGVDAVIHLAGEPIAGGRWTADRRRRIMESRTAGTTLLADTLAGLRRTPRVLLAASAVGIYGDRGDEPLTEEAPLRPGREASFVERVGHAWEAATASAEAAGIRVVRARIGLVLTPAGGALGQMLLPFRVGLGGRLGDGRQYFSWISLTDVLGALYHALWTESLRGPVNLTAPAPVTNREFTQVLAGILNRPALMPVPTAVLQLLLGDLADELLLASARVLPDRLLRSGYRFQHSGLAAALRHELGR